MEIFGDDTYTTSYEYDKDNRVAKISDGTVSKTYHYDTFGRGDEQVTKDENGVQMKTDSYTFELLRPDDIYTSAQVSSHEIFTMNFRSEYFYEYDKNGNITKITKGDDQSLVAQYEYDTLNQLTREDSADGNFTRTWSYDRIGNILDCKEYTYSPTVATDDLGVPVKTYRYDYTLTGWKDQLESVSLQEGNQAPVTQKEYERDNVGNPISDGTWTYTWQYGRQLASMENPAEEAAENDEIWYYTYNADGLRTKREHKDDGLIVGTWEYIYNGSQLVQMTKGNDTLRFTYDAGGLPMTVTHKTGNSEAIYYYVTNLQGDVIALLDQQTRAVAEYAYDAWGNPLGTVPTTGIGALNPLRYRGYVWDAETGLYLTGTRYYDPEIGRFINADSLIDNRGIITQNLFQYCGNNPVNNADPSGNLFGAIVGIGLLVIGMVVTLSGCSSKPAASPSKPSTPSKPSNPSSSSSSTTSPHIPTPQEKSYAATVYAEAGGQNKRSKQAVAHVMNNRIGTRSSWTDIESVISAKYQFDGYNSPMYQAAMNYYNNGICNNSIEQASMDECLAVVIPIYSGAESDITGGALYFHSFANPSDWAYHNSYTQVYVSGTEKFWFYK